MFTIQVGKFVQSNLFKTLFVCLQQNVMIKVPEKNQFLLIVNKILKHQTRTNLPVLLKCFYRDGIWEFI